MGKHWTKDEIDLMLANVANYQGDHIKGLKEWSSKCGRTYQACYKKYKQLEDENQSESVVKLTLWQRIKKMFS